MKIRTITVDDYDDLYTLWLSCPGMGLNNLDDSKEGIAKYLNRNPETCFAAEIDDQMVGAILSGHDGRRGHICHTAVTPAFQKQGIGRALVKAAVSALREQGINKVNLVVFDYNQAGNAFWQKLGFTARPDLVYRNMTLNDMERIDT